MSDITSNVPFFIITAIFGVFLWGMSKRIENAVGKRTIPIVEEGKSYKPDPKLVHLAIHYLRIKGSSDTPDSAQLRYVSNDKNRRAYRIRELPDWLAMDIKEHKIRWCPYDDGRILRRNLSADYSTYETDPLPETLGLKFINGQWKEYSPHSDLLSRLQGHRLENLQVLTLTRRYFFSEIRRVLLVKFAKNAGKSEVWLAPQYIFELVENDIIDEETKGMRFWETCAKWCRRNGYTFIDRRYPESELLAERS